MKKIMYVGDYHCQVGNLKDCRKLMDFIIENIKKKEVDTVIFLGDQFHTHAIVRLEVQKFWYESLRLLNLTCPTYLLVGNHDMKGDNESSASDINSMMGFNAENILLENINIIDKPTNIDGIGMLPYYKDKEQFLKDCQELYDNGVTELIIAHQTFTGATYENGFYAEDGIDPEIVPQKAIISGHIHKQQQIGKCDYPGTPKWDKMSDANEDKGIWIYTHNKDCSVKSKKFISTKKVVTPIYKIVVNEGDEEPKLVKNARNYIEFVGKSAWITKMKKKYKNKAQIKARPTDRKRVKFEGKDVQTIKDYLFNSFEVVDGVKKEDIGIYLEGLENAS